LALASSELVRQREGKRPEHQDVLVLQRREPGEVLVVDLAGVAGEVADGRRPCTVTPLSS